MKVLRIHAPGTDAALADAITRAVEAFNRSLDIRLRFLAIEIDEEILVLETPEQAVERLGETMKAHGASTCVILGDGAVALAAATAAVRARGIVVRVGAGERGVGDVDSARALDRIAGVLLAHTADAAGVLASEGVDGAVEVVGGPSDADVGERIVQVLSQVRRTVNYERTGDG